MKQMINILLKQTINALLVVAFVLSFILVLCFSFGEQETPWTILFVTVHNFPRFIPLLTLLILSATVLEWLQTKGDTDGK